MIKGIVVRDDNGVGRSIVVTIVNGGCKADAEWTTGTVRRDAVFAVGCRNATDFLAGGRTNPVIFEGVFSPSFRNKIALCFWPVRLAFRLAWFSFMDMSGQEFRTRGDAENFKPGTPSSGIQAPLNAESGTSLAYGRGWGTRARWLFSRIYPALQIHHATIEGLARTFGFT